VAIEKFGEENIEVMLILSYGSKWRKRTEDFTRLTLSYGWKWSKQKVV
jgi:hypothetical protein